MSDKYIIKNCPCFVEGIAIKGNEQKTQTCNNHKVRELTYCADITDCVMKQIVEYCKTTRDVYCYGQKHNIRWIDANNILKKIDIQEVE